MKEKLYNPADYEFAFGEGVNYRWHSGIAHRNARMTRNADLLRYQREGVPVQGFVRRDQVVKRGGPGTGHPEIVLTCDIYGIKFL